MIAALRRRSIGAAYGLLFAVVATAMAGSVYWVAQHDLAVIVDARLERQRAAMLGPPDTRDLASIRTRIERREAQRSISEVGHALFDAQGRRLAGTVQTGPVPDGYSDTTFRETGSKPSEGRALAVPLEKGGRLVIVAESELAEDFLPILTRMFLWMFGFAIIAGVVTSLALSQAITARMKGMRRAAEAIIAGDLTQRMPIDGSGSAFDEQARTLNRMLDRVADLMANVKQVSGDIAHDLRTPLARVVQLLDSIVEAPERRDTLQRVRQARLDCQQLLRIFGALLRISEIDAGARRADFRPVRLDLLATEIVDTFLPAIEDEGRSITIVTAGAVTVPGDRDLMTQLLVNLIENAARHTPQGARITVAVNITSGMPALTVSDDGDGIPLAKRSEVMRRFVRLEASRTRPGNGLGLALVEAIARLHDATVTLEDAQPGLRVRVAFESCLDAAGVVRAAAVAA